MNSATYADFLKRNFVPWYRKQRVAFRRNIIFMQDNAPPHAAHFTIVYLRKVYFNNEKLLIWPASSPDLNPIKTFGALYHQRGEFTVMVNNMKGIRDATESIGADEI